MSKDLYLGTTKKNWARGACAAPITSSPNLVLTDAEKKRLEQLAIVKMRSDAGDEKEQKHWQKLRGDLGKQRARARRGDKKAARLVAVLDESGLFGQFQQTFAMRGEEQKFPNPFGDQAAKPLPRKPNPFAVEKGQPTRGLVRAALQAAADNGNVRAQIELRKRRIRDDADREEREGMSGATEILGAFVGDEARAEQESCGATEILGASFFGRVKHKVRSQQKIARLQRRASAGDARAQARLREIQARFPSSLPYGAIPPAAASPYQQTAYSQSNPYAGLPPLPPDEEYVQDVYV